MRSVPKICPVVLSEGNLFELRLKIHTNGVRKVQKSIRGAVETREYVLTVTKITDKKRLSR